MLQCFVFLQKKKPAESEFPFKSHLLVETSILIPYLISFIAPLKSLQSSKVYLSKIWLIGCGKRNPRRLVCTTLTLAYMSIYTSRDKHGL